MPTQSTPALALAFIDHQITAALWQEVNGKITIISRSQLLDLPDGNWPETVDQALEELGEEGLSIKDILFVVPLDWTKDGQLDAKYKKKLHQLSQELTLEPMGFVILEEGLCTWQENISGLAFNGLIINHQANKFQVRLFTDGQLQSAFDLGKSGDLASDLQELQARLQKEGSQFQRILYLDTSGENQKYDQSVVLIKQQLDKPVEKISPQQVAQIVISAGAGEVTGAKTDSNLDTSDQNTAAAQHNEPNTANSVTSNPDLDGFSTPDFVINRREEPTTLTTDSTAVDDMVNGPTDQTKLQSDFKKSQSNKLAWLTKIKWPALPKLGSLNLSSSPKNKLVLIGLGIIGLLLTTVGGSFIYFANHYTAQVNIKLTQQDLETITMVNLQTSTASAGAQIADKTLPAQIITETVTVESEVPTTGTQLTGDPAKGQITIFNKSSQEKTFPAGTLVYYNDLEFSLDQEVKVASASTQEDRGSSTTEYGEVSVSVTAEEFGPEGNLTKDNELTIANFGTSSYYALVDDDFSGGTKREIQAVAQRDLDQAIADLQKVAQDQLQAKFSELNDSKKPVLFANQIETINRTASAEVGAEAKLLSLSMEVEGQAYQFDLADLTKLADQVFENELQADFNIAEDSIKMIKSELVDTTDSVSPQLEIQIQAKAVPNVDPQQIKENLAGTYSARASVLLTEQPGIDQAEAKIEPGWITPFFKKLPKDTNRINLNLELKNN